MLLINCLGPLFNVDKSVRSVPSYVYRVNVLVTSLLFFFFFFFISFKPDYYSFVHELCIQDIYIIKRETGETLIDVIHSLYNMRHADSHKSL